jgi:hypothetical protein
MLPTTLFLAQADSATSEGTAIGFRKLLHGLVTNLDILHHPDMLLDQLEQLPFVIGSVLLAVGLLCVFNGYRWHRWVVIVLAFLCGLGIGQMINDDFGRSNIVAVALGCLLAILATPLMKIAVAIFSGMTGAFIGANVWTALNETMADQHWAGAAMGFIALAMASVILFRVAIVLFTSVGGAALVVAGAITLLLQVDGWEPAIRESLSSHQLMIPMLVALAAVGGFVLQEARSRQEALQED